jgi:DNA-binding transcriptional LysR family regulator
VQEPDWNDFKIMLALASAGSVAGAARELGVDGSTISRRLAALEDSLGARLIVRGGQKFAWTAEGRSVLSAAEAIQAAVQEAARAVRTAKADAALAVTMSCPPGLIATISNLMSSLRAKRPELTLELCGENRAVDITKGEADIALRMFRPSDPGLVCRQVFEIGWAVYGAESYLAAHPAPAAFSDLAKHQVIRYVNSMHKVPGPRWLEEHRGAASTSVQVDNTEAAAQLVAAGQGLGVLPCPVADVRGDLVRVFAQPVAFGTGYLVYHESARDTACVRAAVAVLAEVFEEHRTHFSGRRA